MTLGIAEIVITSYSIHYTKLYETVGEIMTRNVITISPDVSVEEATTLLHDNHIGCLPVLEDGNLSYNFV